MFKCIFLNENVWIPIEISLKFIPKGSINNNPALFQIMAWCSPGDKPLSEPMMARLLTHICVTRLRWVKKVQLALELPYYCKFFKQSNNYRLRISNIISDGRQEWQPFVADMCGRTSVPATVNDGVTGKTPLFIESLSLIWLKQYFKYMQQMATPSTGLHICLSDINHTISYHGQAQNKSSFVP